MSSIKARRTHNLRYKRPALASLGYDAILDELDNIEEACADIHWFIDQDDETLLNALDGDEEQTFEFKMAFADLEGKVYQLREAIRDNWGWSDHYYQVYDDCTVALIGNRYRTIGWDGEEEDYCALTRYEQELAQTEAGKRFMRMTKAEMISTIGQCLGSLIAFLDVRQSYDYLKATFDILRDENTSLLKQIKEIEAAYEAVAGKYSWEVSPEDRRRFELLLEALPDRAWIE